MGRAASTRSGRSMGALSATALTVVAAVEPQLAERLSEDLLSAGYRVTPMASGSLPPDTVLVLVQPAPDRSLRVLQRGPLALDLATYQATLRGEPLNLTYMEWSLLRFLAASPGTVHMRRAILANVWGYDFYGGVRTVDVHVRRLRAKLGDDHGLIETVRSVGYRFSPRSSA